MIIDKLIDLFVKHYRTSVLPMQLIVIIITSMIYMEALVQIHQLVLGLDVLGNAVEDVRVVERIFELFYEPIKVLHM